MASAEKSQEREEEFRTGQQRAFNKSQATDRAREDDDLFRPSSTQDAYDRCASEVVDLLRCVEQKGATWFWACNHLHISLQKCYELNKNRTPLTWSKVFSKSRSSEQEADERTVNVQKEEWQWWLQDLKEALWPTSKTGPAAPKGPASSQQGEEQS